MSDIYISMSNSISYIVTMTTRINKQNNSVPDSFWYSNFNCE
jgi:hypothetical protein